MTARLMELEMLIRKLGRIKTDFDATLSATEAVIKEISNDEHVLNMRAKAPKQ